MPVETIKAPLSGKVAVITGGSRGLGQAIAIDFARKGCSHIAISYVSSDPSETLDAIQAVSPDVVTCAIRADVNDDDFGAQVIKRSLEGLKVHHLDIIVSNASLVDQAKYLPVGQIDKKTFDMYMTTNAWAGFHLAMSAIAHIRPNTDGRIIFISSGGSKQPFGDPLAGHCFGKAAMDSISSNLGKIYGKKLGITVNSIGVGVTETASFQKAAAAWPGYREIAEKLSSLERAAQPEEVARIVSFVASRDASWINGNQVPANGGMLNQLQSEILDARDWSPVTCIGSSVHSAVIDASKEASHLFQMSQPSTFLVVSPLSIAKLTYCGGHNRYSDTDADLSGAHLVRMSAPTLLTLPSEIRQLIWQNVFVNTTCSPKALPESKYYEDFCEVCQKEPPSALPIDTAIRPLLICRKIYGEASLHFYASLTVIITNPTQAYALTTPKPRRLANRLKDLVIYNHLDLSCPHLQASALEKLFSQLPRLSLQRIVVHNHMHPPSSYDLLCPGIFYMSPLLAGQPTPYKEWRTKVDLNFAYRWDYLMFESPLLGEIRTNDALDEHEKVLRELLDDERFKRGVREESDEAQTWALLRIARSHERTWLESLRRKRMESLSQEEIDAIEREMAVNMELGVADDEESSDSD